MTILKEEKKPTEKEIEIGISIALLNELKNMLKEIRTKDEKKIGIDIALLNKLKNMLKEIRDEF